MTREEAEAAGWKFLLSGAAEKMVDDHPVLFPRMVNVLGGTEEQTLDLIAQFEKNHQAILDASGQ